MGVIQNDVAGVELPEAAAVEFVCLNVLQDDVAYQVFARLIHGCIILQFALIVKYDNSMIDVTICQ